MEASVFAVHPNLVAASVFVDRQSRRKNPPGKFDKGGRFYASERCACCYAIRPPSRAWPYSEMIHARTLRHVCHVYHASESKARKLTALFQ